MRVTKPIRRAPGDNLLARLLIANATQATFSRPRKRASMAFSIVFGFVVSAALWLVLLWSWGMLPR